MRIAVRTPPLLNVIIPLKATKEKRIILITFRSTDLELRKKFTQKTNIPKPKTVDTYCLQTAHQGSLFLARNKAQGYAVYQPLLLADIPALSTRTDTHRSVHSDAFLARSAR